jgi:hypothetical protein
MFEMANLWGSVGPNESRGMIQHPIDGAIDRRARFRVPAVEQRVGRLRIAQQEILVELLDESAEGFAILLGGVLECHVGQTALLQTQAGWAEVRVMNASVAQAATTSDDAGESREVACTRLGLQRLRDVPVKHRSNWFAAWAPSLRRPLVPLFSTWSGAVLTVFTVVCGGALMVTGLEYPRGVITLVRRELPHPPAPTAAPESASRSKNWTAWLEFPWQIHVPSGGTASDAPYLSPEIVRCTRPEFLLHPDTIEKLALSEFQLRKLKALTQSRSVAGNGSWDRQAAQSVIAMLTTGQLAKLKQLAHAGP